MVLVLELLGLQGMSMPAIGTGGGPGSVFSTSTLATASTTHYYCAAVCTEATMVQKSLHVSSSVSNGIPEGTRLHTCHISQDFSSSSRSWRWLHRIPARHTRLPSICRPIQK